MRGMDNILWSKKARKSFVELVLLVVKRQGTRVPFASFKLEKALLVFYRCDVVDAEDVK